MAHLNLNGGVNSCNTGVVSGRVRCFTGRHDSSEYSGDERESRSIEEHPDNFIGERPLYLLEHLATFTVNKASGIVCPADGMRRLLQLEKTTGIWSQKMQLCLDNQWVLIMDFETGNIIERFPASLIQEPTAFTSTDAMQIYNNILVFIVSGGVSSRSEMHIFQSQSVPAVHLVEDLKSLRNGKLLPPYQEGRLQNLQTHLHQSGGETACGIVSTPSISLHDNKENQIQQQLHHHILNEVTSPRINMNQYDLHVRIGVPENNHAISGGISETDSDHGCLNDETSSTSSDTYERDVTVLNHCFDDIEKFIARLQHAAAATRELERRRHNRKTKKKDPGEGILTMRTRPPHEEEFVDIFAKFKLSFNLLAKLRAHIHDPNAPELVHFLFTPLALIVEASSDTYYESQLPSLVVNPLLTREAINLLINCVTSKETELWRSLGEAWIIPREQWKSDIGSYRPIFMDGWSPDYLIIEENEASCTRRKISKSRLEARAHLNVSHRSEHASDNRLIGGKTNLTNAALYIEQSEETTSLIGKYPDSYERVSGHNITSTNVAGITSNSAIGDPSTHSEISIDSIDRSGTDFQGIRMNGMQDISSGMQQLHIRDSNSVTAIHNINTVSEFCGPDTTGNDMHSLKAWLNELQAVDAKIVLVTYPRTANNDKELSVIRGEYLEILDDTRKWWKARNIHGQVAHVPNTIVAPYNYPDDSINSQFHEHHVDFRKESNNYPQSNEGIHLHNDIIESQRSQDTIDWIGSKNLCKKGELRYF